jgi:hypothetical protein
VPIAFLLRCGLANAEERARGATALTLTTFDDVPWNGPYYTRLGFRMRDLATLSPGLQTVEQAEAGLPMVHRICMQLDLYR